MRKRYVFLALATLAFAAGVWLFSGTGQGNILLASLKDAFFPRPQFQLLAEVDPRTGTVEEGGEIGRKEFGGKRQTNSPPTAAQDPLPRNHNLTAHGEKPEVVQQQSGQPENKLTSRKEPEQFLAAAVAIQDKSKKESIGPCQAKRGGVPAAKVLFNEIAWMGTEHSPQDEWIELRNWENREVDLFGWRVQSADNKFALVIAPHRQVPARGYFLLERSDDRTVPQVAAGEIYEGALRDAGMHLLLLDSACVVVDEIDASGGWEQYGGDRATRRTMERDADLAGWHTSANVGGTPGKRNSHPAAARPSPTEAHYEQRESTAAPPVIASGTTALSMPSTRQDGVARNVVISEVFANAEGSDKGKEFVELYNPTANAIDLTGWKLQKNGKAIATIGSKKEDHTSIPPGGFFLIGCNRYNGAVAADVVRSASLPNTSATLTLYDSEGNEQDHMSYSSAAEGKSWERKAYFGGRCLVPQGDAEDKGNACATGAADDFVVRESPLPQNSASSPEPSEMLK